MIGFFLANLCLRLPVNFLSSDPSYVITDPKDPRFLGAWWLGLIIIGIFIILSSLPLFFFPRQLPGSEIYRKRSLHRSLSESSNKQGFVKGDISTNDTPCPAPPPLLLLPKYTHLYMHLKIFEQIVR